MCSKYAHFELTPPPPLSLSLSLRLRFGQLSTEDDDDVNNRGAGAARPGAEDKQAIERDRPTGEKKFEVLLEVGLMG